MSENGHELSGRVNKIGENARVMRLDLEGGYRNPDGMSTKDQMELYIPYRETLEMLELIQRAAPLIVQASSPEGLTLPNGRLLRVNPDQEPKPEELSQSGEATIDKGLLKSGTHGGTDGPEEYRMGYDSALHGLTGHRSEAGPQPWRETVDQEGIPYVEDIE